MSTAGEPKPEEQKPERPSMLVLFLYSLGKFLGRRRLVTAFLLGLDEGVTDRAYRSRHGRWPDETPLSAEQVIAVAAAVAEEIQARTP